MTRRDISLTIALCASLILHALLLGSAAEMFVRDLGRRIWMPGWPRQPQATALLVEQPFHAAAPADPMDRLGDSAGTGDAINTSPGDEPMQAPKGDQTQSFLSLDPQGFGKIGQDPVDSALPLAQAGSAGDEGAEPQPPAQPQQRIPESFGVSTTGGDFAVPPFAKPAPPDTPPRQPDPREPQPGEDVTQSAPPAPQQATASSAVPSPSAPGSPGVEASADPAPQGGSESDPVATVGTADFRPGKTDVRLGRGHKLIRPRLSLAARADLLTLRSPVVVLKIKIDDTGKVTHVAVVRSSGSNEVDQPCKLAAYNWWFEPLKDKNGRPIKDEILFAVRFI